ncbi:hypothetical protein [Granulicella arctica]|uniref:hypothetical protein n=1 Tax=Granulicella arctica TaxID=940613 RepID=UPI0021DFE477|nr:hypothetical protein [Granulicella arctica]
MTEELFREILAAAKRDIETLQIEKTLIDSEGAPTSAECSSIEGIQVALKFLVSSLQAELPK